MFFAGKNNRMDTDVHGCLWISMDVLDIHGYPWMSMDIQGYPWISLDINAYDVPMDIHGHPWISMDIQIGYLSSLGHPKIASYPTILDDRIHVP